MTDQQRIECLEKQVTSLREALNRLDSLYRSEQDEPGNRPEWLHQALSTTTDLSKDFVKREVLEKCVEALSASINSDGHAIYCVYDTDGNNPDTDYCTCGQRRAFKAVTLAQKELGENRG